MTPRQIDAWNKLHEQESALGSPFTTYGFCRAVDEVRGNVFVSILENRGEVQAIFPFERQYRLIPGIARKPGGHLSDSFGIIGGARRPLNGQELLKSAAFQFSHSITCPYRKMHCLCGGEMFRMDCAWRYPTSTTTLETSEEPTRNLSRKLSVILLNWSSNTEK